MIGERLKEERERLGYTQPVFAEAAGAAKRTLIEWEKGNTSPSAVQLSALMKIGVDALYILTGQRSELPDLTHSAGAVASWEIDAQRLARIVEMLEVTARVAGRKWPARELISVAAEVYNALGNARELDEPKVERILKLVVNR